MRKAALICANFVPTYAATIIFTYHFPALSSQCLQNSILAMCDRQVVLRRISALEYPRKTHCLCNCGVALAIWRLSDASFRRRVTSAMLIVERQPLTSHTAAVRWFRWTNYGLSDAPGLVLVVVVVVDWINVRQGLLTRNKKSVN